MSKVSASKPSTIDQYLKGVSPKIRSLLVRVREAIRYTAPDAEESISYGVPSYKLNGKPLVYFGAGKEHGSIYGISQAIVKTYSEELDSFDKSKGTIRFTPDNPLPITLLRKMVKARILENKERENLKKEKKVVKKNETPQKRKVANVEDYLKNLRHPLKKEIAEVRSIIIGSDRNLKERIKWSAPSYHIGDNDLVTFNAWSDKKVHLVFHHPEIVKIKSPILEGDYPTRRMVYFENMKEVKENNKELDRVMKDLIKRVK